MDLRKELSHDSGITTDREDDALLGPSDAEIRHGGDKKHLPQDGDIDSKVFSEANFNRLTFIKTMTIEPFMFLFMFAYLAKSMCTTKLIIDKACKFNLNYSDEVCANLNNYTDMKEEVERITNNYGMYTNLVHMGLAAIAMMFIGSWSDKYGRKLPLLLSIAGMLLDDVGLVLNTVYYTAPLQYIVLSAAPSGITGGFISVMSISYSLSSEITTKRMRTLKYALVEFAFAGGMAIGQLAGGLIHDFKIVFSICVAAHAGVIPWILFVLPETRGKNLTISWTTKLRDLFSLSNIDEGFKACRKVRENHGRCQIWMLLMSISCIVLTYASFTNIAYIYTFHRYGWSMDVYSEVNTIFIVLGLVMTVLCVPVFLRILKLRDPALGLIGSVSLMSKNMCTAFAKYTYLYYIGYTLGLIGGTAILSVRSHISKIVEKDELCKVFSFLSACESLVPLAGTMLISKVYNATMHTHPGMAYFIGSLFLLVPVGTFTWLCLIKASSPPVRIIVENGSIQDIGKEAAPL